MADSNLVVHQTILNPADVSGSYNDKLAIGSKPLVWKKGESEREMKE